MCARQTGHSLHLHLEHVFSSTNHSKTLLTITKTPARYVVRICEFTSALSLLARSDAVNIHGGEAQIVCVT